MSRPKLLRWTQSSYAGIAMPDYLGHAVLNVFVLPHSAMNLALAYHG